MKEVLLDTILPNPVDAYLPQGGNSNQTRSEQDAIRRREQCGKAGAMED